MDMSTVQRTPGKIRRTIHRGETVSLTFREIPFAAVLPLSVLNKLLDLAGDEGHALIKLSHEEEAHEEAVA